MLKARHSPLPLRSSPNGTLCRAIGSNIIAKEDRNVKCELQLKKRRINAAESVFAQAFEFKQQNSYFINDLENVTAA